MSTLIVAALGHLRGKGLLALPGEELAVSGDGPDVVVADDEAVAVLLAAVDREALDVGDDDAYEVVRALLAHLADIGALGPPA